MMLSVLSVVLLLAHIEVDPTPSLRAPFILRMFYSKAISTSVWARERESREAKSILR